MTKKSKSPSDRRDALPDDTDLYFAARRRSIRRLGVVLVIAVIVGPILLASWLFWTPLERWIRGETDLSGNPSFTYRPSEDELDGLERVHADLFPTWVIAEANIENYGKEHADDSYGKLRAGLDDPNLDAILSETHAIVRGGEQVEKAERLDELMRSWTTYLTDKGEPYLVQGNVAVKGSTAFFYVKTYRVASDLRIAVGDDDYRSRIVRRLDSTNVRESYLGQTSKGADGAVVLLDRLYAFALDDVWPLLDESRDDELDATHRAWAPSVRAEMADALPAPDIEALRRALGPWRAIEETLDAIEARAECGNTLVISEPGHRGVYPSALATLERWATDDPLDLCPAITDEELTVLRDASQKLRDDDAFDRAMGALVARLGAGISLHEARHVADDVRHDGLATPLPCAVCGDRVMVSTRAELSAYLSSFAWGDSPQTTYFQACLATRTRGGPHGRAMRLINDGLEHRCADGAPAELTERARKLEAQWFGRTERISLPPEYPKIVDVRGLRL